MPAPTTLYRSARRQDRPPGSDDVGDRSDGASVGRQATRHRRPAPPAPGAGADPWRGDVQLSLGCDAEILLDVEATRRQFGSDPVCDAWARWIPGFFAGGATFVTLTYSDEGAKLFKPYRPAACFGDVWRWLDGLHYDGPLLEVCEEHRWRDVLHVHGLMRSMGPSERLWLQESWYAQHGRARLLPATPGAFPYVVKYALKAADRRGDFVDLRHLPTFRSYERGAL